MAGKAGNTSQTALNSILEYLNNTSVLLRENLLQGDNTTLIEIEARIGRISSTVTKKRLQLSSLNPIVFYQLPRNSFFASGVEKDTFDLALSILKEPTKIVCDKVFSSGKIRKVVRDDGQYFQEKVKIGTVDIYFPNSPWDVRIGVSKETPLEKPAIECKWSKARCRKRWSFERQGYVVDLTEVAADSKSSDPVYEIEWEVLNHEPGYKNFIMNVFEEIELLKTSSD